MIPGGHIINDGLCSPCYHCPIGRTSRPGSKKQEITVKTREVKKHVSSNQAHVVSSNQPIQKRFNVANPGLTKPGFSGDSADLLDDQRVLLSKFFVIGPKNHAIYILYIIYPMNIWLLVWNKFGLFFPFSWECHHPNWRIHIFQRGRYTTNQILIPIKVPLDAHEIIMKSPWNPSSWESWGMFAAPMLDDARASLQQSLQTMPMSSYWYLGYLGCGEVMAGIFCCLMVIVNYSYNMLQ